MFVLLKHCLCLFHECATPVKSMYLCMQETIKYLFILSYLKTIGSTLEVLIPIMSMAATWHRLCVGPSDMYLNRKVSGHRYATKGSPRPVLQERVLGCIFTRCKQPDCFLRYMSINLLWGVISMVCVFRAHVTQWLLCQTDEINTIFNPSSVIYIWDRRRILVLLLMFVDWYKYSNSNGSDSKCI